MTNRETKYQAALYLRGKDLDPAYVSSILGVDPTSSQHRGEQHLTSTKKEFVTKIGIWALIEESDSVNVSGFVEEIDSKLGAFGSSLSKIDGVEEAYIDVFVAMSGDRGGATCELDFSSENVKVLNRFGLPIRVTVTFTC
jgi:hypothetical protein